MGTLGQAHIGISTFFACPHPTDQCGTNGLPLTPNSIVIKGHFQVLKTIYHQNVCQYLDIVRAKHERLIVVEEFYQDSLLKNWKHVRTEKIPQIAFETLHALAYLNRHGIVHRNLSPGNILLDPEGHVKLCKSGLYYMTGHGSLVSFPIGSPKHMAPEVVVMGPGLSPVYGPSSAKVDVWSLGIILADIIMGGSLFPDVSGKNEAERVLQKVMSFTKKGSPPCAFDVLLPSPAVQKLQELCPHLPDFLRQCLTVSPEKRPAPADLLNHEMFSNFDKEKVKHGYQHFPAVYRSFDLQLPDAIEELSCEDVDEDLLAERPLTEVYYLWTLAGGDVVGELKKKGLVKNKPPILGLPNVLLHSRGGELGVEKDRILLLDETVIPLSLSQLKERLQHVDPATYYPLIEEDDPIPKALSETATLPIGIREKTVDYQLHRVVLFHRLLHGYPYTRRRVVQEAKIDIPPLLRGKIWAALLGVRGDIQSAYCEIDKESVTPTDRQIEVDIPRCHQYDELLSSPTAHYKFKRILKAWVVSQSDTELVYWQGLDSLCAPFVSLNFNNEALAFACLDAFIPKYLYNFFEKDNSKIIKEYLAVFSQLIAFHHPELFNHLDDIGFIPELYSIPWFLTMFCHVFPLEKIFLLWDTLLLFDSSFPLFIGVAILEQLKEQLLSFGFNECILLFSDMPDIDMERVIVDSKRIFYSTPRTAAERSEDSSPNRNANCNPNDEKSGIEKEARGSDAAETVDIKKEKDALHLDILATEVCVRISTQDLLRTCDVGDDSNSAGLKSGAGKKRKSRFSGLIVDIRSTDEFNTSRIPGSVNLPYNQALLEGGGLAPSPAANTLANHKGNVVIVMGNSANYPAKIAEKLVKLEFPKVCVLEDSGLTKLRTQGILAVPTY